MSPGEASLARGGEVPPPHADLRGGLPHDAPGPLGQEGTQSGELPQVLNLAPSACQTKTGVQQSNVSFDVRD